jgi:hypothetical protein
MEHNEYDGFEAFLPIAEDFDTKHWLITDDYGYGIRILTRTYFLGLAWVSVAIQDRKSYAEDGTELKYKVFIEIYTLIGANIRFWCKTNYLFYLSNPDKKFGPFTASRDRFFITPNFWFHLMDKVPQPINYIRSKFNV